MATKKEDVAEMKNLACMDHLYPLQSRKVRAQAFDSEDIGVTCDLKSIFVKHRSVALEGIQGEVNAQQRNPICGQKTSLTKCAAIEKEVQKLINRYRENSGKLRGFLSEVKSQPAWQKLPQWIEPSRATACYKCSCRFRPFSTKTNCRIGGQVFCSSCCNDQMVIFDCPEGTKWAINGKQGGPSTIPSSYTLIPVCCNCSNELQALLSDNCTTKTDFIEQLQGLHKAISKLQFKIDLILPKYLVIVDSLSMDAGSPNSISEKNPIQFVAKAHCDLLYIFDMQSTNFQKLKCLNPCSETEEKLQSNVGQCSRNFVQEKSKFQLAKSRLSDIMPLQDLKKVQMNVSERNILHIYNNLQRLEFELSCLAQIYKLNVDIMKTIRVTRCCIEEECSTTN